MKVRELIARSVLTEGASRASSAPPRVSVLLPTFRRGDSGMLTRTIDSLLAQEFDDFELIIVDDASVDSTASVIADAMRRDPRISVIRHARNIGLPAVSEYEAFRIARGELFAFAFDDTVFEPDALRRLVEASEAAPGAMIAGWVRAFIRSADGALQTEVLGAGATEQDLLGRNPIPNSAVLVPRRILEEIGLYDPHVSLARLCDYDLWLRVRRVRPIVFVDICVGEEHGAATSDSLGATYPLDQWLADDRMRQHRTSALKPEDFAEVDVFECKSFASTTSRRAVEALAAGHVGQRPWMRPPDSLAAAGRYVPRVLVLAHPINASVLLIFEAMRDSDEVHVRVVDRVEHSLSDLARADVLIIARDFRLTADWSAAAIAMGVPVFYYLDDNIPLMVQRGELDPQWAHFAAAEVHRALAGFAGVLTSTQELARSFREQGLHEHVDALQIAIPASIGRDWRAAPRREEKTTTIALFVGDHRVNAYVQLLHPGLADAAAATGRRVRVLAPPPVVEALAGHERGIELQTFPVSLDYFTALRGLRDAGVDAVLVPPVRTVNQRFKTTHPLLTAAVLGARLIAPSHVPYVSLADVPGVLLVDEDDRRDEDVWREAFERTLVDDRVDEGGGARRGVPVESINERFSGITSAARLMRLVAPLIPPAATPESRLVALSTWLSQQLMHSREVGVRAMLRGTSEEYSALVLKMYDALKRSRRLYAFRRSSGPLSWLHGDDSTMLGYELSEPLHLVPYLEYSMRLAAGRYDSASLELRGAGEPGDMAGIELVAPDGAIVVHAFNTLAPVPGPHLIRFGFAEVFLPAGEFRVRVFVRSERPIFARERVARGPLGLARPRRELELRLYRSDDG